MFVIKPGNFKFTLLILFYTVISCNKEEDKIFEHISFPAEVYFDKFDENVDLSISNSGSETLWLTITFNEVVNFRNEIETMQILQAGGILDLPLTLNRLMIDEELFQTKIQIYIPAIDRLVEVPVRVKSVLPEYINLDFNIIDAVYYENDNEIIAISTQPENTLLRIDPINGDIDKVPLNSKPLSLHVNADIQKAAIGQTDRYTVVDLNSNSITKESQTEISINPIFMPNEEWLYAIREDYSNLYVIDLLTGEATYENYSDHLKIEFHPHHENYLLINNTRVHPSLMEVYDFSNRSMSKLYESSRGDDERDVHGNFWITKDNNWIISKGRCLFTCSPNHEDDVNFVKMLDGGKFISSLCHLNNTGNIATINRNNRLGSSDENSIAFYDDSQFNLIGKFPLPVYYSEGSSEASESTEGKFIFRNNQQDKLFLLMTNDYITTEDNKWALLIYDTNKLFDN